MAGTYSEQAQLALTNDFISLVKVSLIKRALELNAEDVKHTVNEINLYKDIISNADGYASRVAWLVACGNPTIGAAAPVVPNSNDTQYAVNQVIPLLVR